MAEIDLIKISELPETSTIGDADELAVVQGGATKKVPYSVLKAGAEVTPDTTLSEAGVPADAAAVGAALALKANQAAVTQALAAKADKTEVTDISGDIAELASVVETKADQTALNQKADKTTTDALRQDLTTLNGIVSQKADKTELNTQIGNVTAELATKANTADVNNLLAAKANVASPVFTGRPQAPTAPKGTATLQLATTAFVQNAIDDKQDTLTFDSTPTEGSTNPVTSGGVWKVIESVDENVTDVVESVGDINRTMRVTKNLVQEIVTGKYCNISGSAATRNQVIIVEDSTRSYVRIPVVGGRTYSASLQFSGSFSFWAYEENGIEYGISKINSFDTNYVMTAPSNATILYLCNTGWTAESNIVVLECDYSIFYEKVSDYPFNKVANVEIAQQADLYNTIDIVGIEKFPYFQRGSITTTGTTPTQDNNFNYTNQRIRTPIAKPLALNAGDVLSINNAENVTYFVCYVGTSVVDTGWLTSDFTAPADGSYWVCIRHENNAELATTEELAMHFTISRNSGIINQRLRSIRKELDGNIPDYYYENGYLKNKVNEVTGKSEILNGVTFAFVTDVHFNANQGNSQKLIKYIRDNTSLDMVVCGGDFCRAYGTAEELASDYQKAIDYINVVGKDNTFAIRGNHDFHLKEAAGASSFDGYTWAKTYNAIYRNSEYMVTDALVQHGAYCIDNAAQKTRFICLNSSDWNLTYDKVEEGVLYISVAQVKWLINALKAKEDWNIIVVSHVASAESLALSEYASQEIVQTVLEAFANRQTINVTYKSTAITADFTSATGTLVFHLSGHAHKDGSSVDNGVLSVLTTCDALYRDDGYAGVAGTITEHAFDVFCINYDTKTIDAVRVGRGSSRNWNYN